MGLLGETDGSSAVGSAGSMDWGIWWCFLRNCYHQRIWRSCGKSCWRQGWFESLMIDDDWMWSDLMRFEGLFREVRQVSPGSECRWRQSFCCFGMKYGSHLECLFWDSWWWDVMVCSAWIEDANHGHIVWQNNLPHSSIYWNLYVLLPVSPRRMSAPRSNWNYARIRYLQTRETFCRLLLWWRWRWWWYDDDDADHGTVVAFSRLTWLWHDLFFTTCFGWMDLLHDFMT